MMMMMQSFRKGDLWLTDNFFRPRWVGMGDRKLKTAFVALEWHPELSKERHKRGLQTRLMGPKLA
eukprot:9713598-Karenia_brevis.AAC.1